MIVERLSAGGTSVDLSVDLGVLQVEVESSDIVGIGCGLVGRLGLCLGTTVLAHIAPWYCAVRDVLLLATATWLQREE